MTLRKIVSLVLCMALSLTVFSSVASADEIETVVYGKESYGLLNAMGITDWTEEELSEPMERADFLKIMNMVAGYGKVESKVQVFADLPLSDEREPYLKALYGSKIIAPDAKGKIYPSGEIGIAEACAVSVRLTGYGVVADAKGGYPGGYMAVAKANDILEGLEVSASEPLTKGMAALLAENTLKAPLMMQVSFGEKIGFEKQTDNCLLNQVHDIYYVEDVVNGVDITRVMGENDVTPLSIEVGETPIYMPYIENPHEAYELLGLKVTAYFTDENFVYPSLVHIVKSSENEEFTFDIDDIEGYDGKKLSVYAENDKTKKYNCSSNTPVIYNGVATGMVFSQDMLEGKSGSVRLVDNSGDNKADVIFVNAYDTYYVSEVDTDNNIVYDKYNAFDASGNPRSIVLDNEVSDPYTVIYDENGEEIKTKSISVGDILAVFESADDAYQGYIVAYIINNGVNGVITETQIGENKLTIDDVTYDITDACIERHGALIVPGQDIVAKLDYTGKIAWVEAAPASDYSYGFIAHAAREKNGLSDNSIKIKMFTQSGDMVLFETTKNIYIDGKRYKTNETGDADPIKAFESASIAMFGTGVFSGSTASLVKYSVNQNYEIKSVDTILNNSGDIALRESQTKAGDVLFSQSTGLDDYCRTANNTIGPKVAYQSSSKMFFYPSPAESSLDEMLNEDNYVTGNASSYLKNGVKYVVTAFNSNSKTCVAEAIGMVGAKNANTSIQEQMRAAVIDEVVKKYDTEEDKIITVVRMLTSVGEAEIPLDRDVQITIPGNKAGIIDTNLKSTISVYDLKKGDFVRYDTYNGGYLATMQLYFRPSTQDMEKGHYNGSYFDYGYPQSAVYRSPLAIRYGFIYDDLNDATLAYYVDNPALLDDPSVLSGVTSADCEIMLKNGSAPTVYRFGPGDFDELEVEESTFAALKSYAATGNDCSRVVMQLYYGVPYVIYELEVE